MSGEDWWYVGVAEGVRETSRMRNYVRKCRMRKSVWAGRCLCCGDVMSVVRMAPVLAELLLMFMAMLIVLEVVSCVFVVAEGVRGWVKAVDRVRKQSEQVDQVSEWVGWVQGTGE